MLGPLLFLVYINDITEILKTNPSLYADDMSPFDRVESLDITSVKLNNDLVRLVIWLNAGLLLSTLINPGNITFSVKLSKLYQPDLFFDNKKIAEVLQHSHLGVKLTTNLSWRAHIVNLRANRAERLSGLKPVARVLILPGYLHPGKRKH